MEDLKEHHVCFTFCFKLEKNAALESRQWEEQNVLWFSKFRSNVKLVEDAESSRCPLTNKTGGNIN